MVRASCVSKARFVETASGRLVASRLSAVSVAADVSVVVEKLSALFFSAISASPGMGFDDAGAAAVAATAVSACALFAARTSAAAILECRLMICL